MSPNHLPRSFLVAIVLTIVAPALPPSARGADVRFIRGDVDGDGNLTLTDALRILTHLFRLANPLDPPAVACEDAADLNDDGSLNVTDPILLLNHLFRAGPPPAAPYPDCGEDPTPDALGCGEHVACEPSFYGLPVEAGTVVFVVERSLPMQDSGELSIARRGIIRNVQELPPDAQFGIVFFSAEFVRFPPDGAPATATPEAKEDAMRFVADLPPGSGRCDRPALLSAIETAKAAAARPRAIYFLAAGGGTCQGADDATYSRDTLAAVEAANTDGIPIHAIGILDPPPLLEEYLAKLAQESGGTYVRFAP